MQITEQKVPFTGKILTEGLSDAAKRTIKKSETMINNYISELPNDILIKQAPRNPEHLFVVELRPENGGLIDRKLLSKSTKAPDYDENNPRTFYLMIEKAIKNLMKQNSK